METRARHLAVGAFVLVLVVCGGLFAIWIAKFSGQVTFVPYYTRFSGSVSQLRTDTTVLFGGIPVGRVTDVRIDSENSELARVDFVVREGTPVRDDSQATIEIQSIAGGVVLQISRGSKEAKLLSPGREVKGGVSPLERLVAQAPNLLNKLTQIAENLNKMLSDENRVALTTTLSNLRDLSVNLNSHQQQIDTLLDNGNVAVSNFSEAGASLKSLADQLNKSAGAMTGDARKAVQSFQEMSAAFKSTADQLNGVITDNREPLKQFTGSALYEATDLIAQLRELAGSMARISQEIERDPARFFLSDRNKGVNPQ
ncbi:MlaD family protein [Dongia sedimenti]|uniref:MlaD family protein n=1 Tax=Dongia sedimenti TaxID=3064282 RepID=A0ABU0YH77_9PROT|nr:MlaD family protein [Rhodospirillaceae bacterium R-7]